MEEHGSEEHGSACWQSPARKRIRPPRSVSCNELSMVASSCASSADLFVGMAGSSCASSADLFVSMAASSLSSSADLFVGMAASSLSSSADLFESSGGGWVELGL